MSELLTSLDIVNQAFKKTMRGYDPSEVDEFLDKVAECIQVYVQKIKDFEHTVEEQTEKLRDYENIKGSLHEALLMAQRTAEEKVTNAAMMADEKVASAERIADEKVAGAERIADEKLAGAASAAENILSDARYKAERMIREAESGVADFGYELNTLQELKKTGFASLRDFVKDISDVLDRAESTGKLQIPHMTLGVLNKFDSQRASQGAYISPSAQNIQNTQAAQTAQAAQGIQNAQNTQNTQNTQAAGHGFDHFGNAIQAGESQPPRDGENQTAFQGDVTHDAREHLSNTLSVLGIDLSLLNTGKDKA
jgi:cell division initiation protein